MNNRKVFCHPSLCSSLPLTLQELLRHTVLHLRPYPLTSYSSITFRESNGSSGSQETHSILRCTTVHCRAHNCPLHVPIRRQINPVYALPSYRSTILILSFHLCLDFKSDLFPSNVPTKILYALLSCRVSAKCPAHLILLEMKNAKCPAHLILLEKKN